MFEFMPNEKASEDFNKARFKEMLSQMKNLLNPEKEELLSFKDVVRLIKPKNEVYKGMQVIPISKIVGSQGRYKDFNKAFFPRYNHLRERWVSIDEAHLNDIILPPIKLYEIGGIYFVRDGNHRVSVAKAKGIKSIDAEVISLRSEIKLKPHITKNELKKSVIAYEKKLFYEQTGFNEIIPPEELDFTTTGRYEDILLHIHVHKYYINQSIKEELALNDAAKSWKINVFDQIIETIYENNILTKFPGRTSADLYCWIVSFWDELKKQYGEDYPIVNAVNDYTYRYGKSWLHRMKDYIKKIISGLRK